MTPGSTIHGLRAVLGGRQFPYMVEGLARFSSVGAQNARGHSPHPLEQSWQVAVRVESQDRICACWRGVVSVEKTAQFSSDGRESKTASTTAVAGVCDLLCYERLDKRKGGVRRCAVVPVRSLEPNRSSSRRFRDGARYHGSESAN